MEFCRLCQHPFDTGLVYYHDGYYCPDCLKKIKAVYPITNHSYKPAPMFFGDDGIPTKRPSVNSSGNIKLYEGVEIEVDEGSFPNVTATTVNSLLDGGFFYCKRDGSLSDNGFEIVSNPATLKCWETKIPLENLREICVSNGFRSDETSTCGLHVHVNRDFFGADVSTREENIAKLVLLVNRFWYSHIVAFSRRKGDSLDEWARKNRIYDPALKTNDKHIYGKCDKDNRYQAINLTNDNTIEFRIFKGSLNVNTILATLQFVDRLCHLAKKIKLEKLLTITWEEVVGYKRVHKELKQYLTLRDIPSNKLNSASVETVIEKYRPPKIKKLKSGLDYSELQPGDIIKIKPWENLVEEFGVDDDGDINCLYSFTRNMMLYCNECFTIFDILSPEELDINDGYPAFVLKHGDTIIMDSLFSPEVFVQK